MTAVRPGYALTLAIHPNSKGFGWCAFEGPLTPYDWGTVRVRRDKNATSLRGAEKLLDRLQPATLVLEAAEEGASKRKGRITKLVRAMIALATGRGIEVSSVAFGKVQASFATIGAITRQDIAEAISRQFEVFRHRLPRRRRAWETEREALAIFSAAALVLTHHRLDATSFLESLS